VSAFFRSREAQLIVMLLAFLATFVPYFINVPPMETFSTKLITISAITAAFTLALAVYSQFMRGTHFIQRRARGWQFKAYMIVGMVLMPLFALVGMETGPYHWVMYAIINPLSSVNYGILAFYMASTCARAFRARNTRALLLLATGFVMLFYQAPLTGAVFPGIEPLALYLGETFVMACGGRMFAISATVGAIVFSVRVLLGKEPSVMGFGREE